LSEKILFRDIFVRTSKDNVKMLCKQVSLSMADLVGELGESLIAGTP
jgi:hypothetical protein